jgi:hypothetical protein
VSDLWAVLNLLLGLSVVSAILVFVAQIFTNSPRLVQIDLVLVGTAAISAIGLLGLWAVEFIHRKYSLAEIEMEIICDDSPAARN